MTRTVNITRAFTFDAAHVLPWHAGKCSRMHGHTYRLEVTVTGCLDSNGIVMDFSDLKHIVHEHVLDSLDHTFLNDQIDNPTAERVALHILETLRPHLPIHAIRLWETADCSAEVRP